MTSEATPVVPLGDGSQADAAMQHDLWRKLPRLSSSVDQIEQFLANSRFERGPWLVVALAGGIALWFALANEWQWLAAMALCLGLALASLAGLAGEGRYPYLRQAGILLPLAVAAGCGLVWTKSTLAGTEPIARPMVVQIDGKVLEREEQPAEHRVRLRLATREPETARAIVVRVNLDLDNDLPALGEGATVRLRARLVPPAPPMLPGGYDFARSAWFSGIAATGGVLGRPIVLAKGEREGALLRLQRSLSQHVRMNLQGSPGALAAAFASGDRGAIAPEDEDAMRDAGLTHLLSISGLHVSAVIAATYFLALRLLALLPWLALRVRLPILAAGVGASAGIGYTLLTGAEVPTIRSCIGAVLVMLALVLGREPLSMRMVAVGAFVILLIWPEALMGPSFQMSFAAVIAIVALHGSERLRGWLAPHEEPWWARGLRGFGSLLLTGVVIELALMPIGLFHFHRSGLYGALANVVAIPLTTLASMPLIALALLFDAVGAGAPFWWLAGKSLELLLALAHWTAAMPGAVTMMPGMGRGTFALFVLGGLWLALWHGRVRLLGLAPVLVASVLVTQVREPDLLISGDGRHVGITGEAGEELLVLRESRSDYTRDNLLETAGMNGATRLLDDWPGARCNKGYCTLRLRRGGRDWQLLMARGSDYIDARALAAACDRVDVVIAARYLPRPCQPRWFKADRRMLDRTGGLTIDLAKAKVTSVAASQGEHGWWRPPPPYRRPNPQPSGSEEADAASAERRPANPAQ
ncbi:MAG: ComEC/Rec2 family competence protein [Novosphingobium sp.]|nr:ComEC/Rec2 family competence protein [Novosphingobium sp.]